MTSRRVLARVQNAAVVAAPHLRELLIVGGAYFAYMYTRAWAFGDVEDLSFENADAVIDFQRSVGFFWEPDWQEWALDRPRAVIVFFNWAYIFTFIPIITVTAVSTYFIDRKTYYYYRNMILVTFVTALIIFALFPLAPPRMIPEYFVDTISEYGPYFYSRREAANYYNAFAAMPSLHFTWSLILGIMFLRSRVWWLIVAGVLYPLLTLLAIVITGNHYISDAIVAGPIVVVSWVTLRAHASLARRRGAGSGERA